MRWPAKPCSDSKSALGRRVHWRKIAQCARHHGGVSGPPHPAASICFRTRCARPMPSTIPPSTASCSAISRPAAPIPGAICPARPSSPACRTTSSPMKRHMRSSTASVNISWSRPTSTFRRSMRLLPTWRRCLLTSPTRTCFCDTLQKTGGRLFDPQLDRRGADRQAVTGAPTIQAQIAAANPLIGLAQQFGEASGMRSALAQRARAPRPNSNDINTKIEPHDRGSILVAAVFDAYFTIYTRRTFDLFRIFRAGGGTTDNGGHSGARWPNGWRPKPAAPREQFFAICARALDYCPPVDITFGDFLRAVLTADLDFHPDDPDGVRDAFMEAFRLRGIVADEAVVVFGEVAVLAEGQARQAARLSGLVFGDPNGLTEDEKDTNGNRLRDFANANARLLGFQAGAGADPRALVPSDVSHRAGRPPVRQHGGRAGADGGHALRRDHARNVSDAQRRHAVDRTGSAGRRTETAAKSAICDPEAVVRGTGGAGAKLLSLHRTGARRWQRCSARDSERFQIDFGLLHAGV